MHGPLVLRCYDYVIRLTVVFISFYLHCLIMIIGSNLHLTNVMVNTAFGWTKYHVFGVYGKVLTSGSRPATRTLKILRLEATGGQTSFQFEFWRQNQVYSCFLFSWLHHAFAILVHSCTFLSAIIFLSQQEQTGMDRKEKSMM